MRPQSISLKTIFLGYIAIALIVTLTAMTVRFLMMQEEIVQSQLHKEASMIEKQWTEMLDYTAYLMNYIGTQITDNTSDLQYIYGLLKSLKKVSESVVPWSSIAWADANHKVRVTSNRGIMTHMPDLSKRDYIPQTVAEPYRLQLGKPVIGVASQGWLVPGGIGVLDKQGEYIGAILTGFIIEELTHRLDNVVRQRGVGFILMEQTGKVITSSKAVQVLPEEIQKLAKIVIKHVGQGEETGLIASENWTTGRQPVVWYQAMHKYPYVLITTYSPQLIDPLTWELFGTFTLQIFVGILLIAGFLYVIHKLVVLPVLTLSSCAQEMVEKEKEVTLPEYSIREIHLLAKGLKDVQDIRQQLTSAHHTMRKLNEELENRVSEQTFALQKALSTKREFIRNMSHEMRIALQKTYSAACGLQEMWHDLPEASKRETLRQIVEGGERMMVLVSNLLDLHTIKSGRKTFEMSENNLLLRIQNVFDDFKEKAYEKGITLVLDHKIGIVPIMLPFDVAHIEQVVRNMLDNAIKFSSSGAITGSFRQQKIHYPDGTEIEGVAFLLRDEGKGIPEEELELIFHGFEQSSRTKTNAGGTGLGLTLCYEIIKAHKGDMWAENNKEGKGTTFIFVLPVHQKRRELLRERPPVLVT